MIFCQDHQGGGAGDYRQRPETRADADLILKWPETLTKETPWTL